MQTFIKIKWFFCIGKKVIFFLLAEGPFSSQVQLCSFELHNCMLCSEVLYYSTLITLYNTNNYHPEYITGTNCNCFPIIFCLTLARFLYFFCTFMLSEANNVHF
jgi:hypothetical protein